MILLLQYICFFLKCFMPRFWILLVLSRFLVLLFGDICMCCRLRFLVPTDKLYVNKLVISHWFWWILNFICCCWHNGMNVLNFLEFWIIIKLILLLECICFFFLNCFIPRFWILVPVDHYFGIKLLFSNTILLKILVDIKPFFSLNTSFWLFRILSSCKLAQILSYSKLRFIN